MEWFAGLIWMIVAFCGIVGYVTWFAQCVRTEQTLKAVGMTALVILLIKIFVFS